MPTNYSGKRLQPKGPNLVSENALPVPVTASVPGVPVLNECAQLDTELLPLARATDANYCHAREALPLLRSALPNIESLRARWRAVDRLATYDDTAAAVSRLTTTMPSAGNVDQNLLTETLCEDIAELRPTLFVLTRACRAHRRKSKFLSIHELAELIERISTRAVRYREALDVDLPERIGELEQQIRDGEIRRAEEQERRKKEDRKRIKELREEFGGQLPEGWQQFFGIQGEDVGSE